MPSREMSLLSVVSMRQMPRGLFLPIPYALMGMAEKLYFPEDDVICHFSTSYNDTLRFYEFNKPLPKDTDRINKPHLLNL